eukprot:TRINITY_DN1979_c0_g1_i1.p1 TRINITY_DN1979_c0_g1~~TRINITY_DN1979_c0_g1_i1.p1  ORF type:complete len:209 (+),score=57.90 TRINITY_DN1979_c0_g1_i1:96-722(+)
MGRDDQRKRNSELLDEAVSQELPRGKGQGASAAQQMIMMSPGGHEHLTREQKKEKLILEGFSGYSWGERISFTVGLTYFSMCTLGAAKGLIEGVPKRWDVPKKLILNNFFNSVGRSAARFGNTSAAASLMYCVIGKTMTVFFEDELANLTPFQTNVLIGAMTGGLFKSTLGLIPFVTGTVLGAAFIAALNTAVDQLNERGMIEFEMKF